MESVDKTVAALSAKNIDVVVVPNGAAALEKIKALIPAGASVMNGSSVTLEQIGFANHLKSDGHKWLNLHATILLEKDPVRQARLRKEASLSDYYLGSVSALTKEGEFIVASNTGSQLPHIVFTSPNLIFVVSTKKIVPDLAAAMKRLEEVVVPLEDKRLRDKYGVGTSLNKIVIFKNESPRSGRKIHMILVEENLGF